MASSDSGRADQRNDLAFVPAVNAKILVGCNRAVVRIKLAHPDQTKIGQIGLLVGITFGQVRQLRQMIIAIEREAHQLVADHLQYDFPRCSDGMPILLTRLRKSGAVPSLLQPRAWPNDGACRGFGRKQPGSRYRRYLSFS